MPYTRPEGLAEGFYVTPTIFANVTNNITIAREEVFGPVLAILPYHDEDEAVAIANDTLYGLSGYVSSGSLELHAARTSRARYRREASNASYMRPIVRGVS